MILHSLLALATTFGVQEDAAAVNAILDAFGSARVVAVGENHGHLEFHDLILSLLRNPRTPEVIDDIAVEWGNSLYQPVIDRYVQGESVPWDSVTMAWRNTIVSPNTVWDAPVYERFFREVRAINAELPKETRYRIILTDSPVDWSAVATVDDLRPFFDRASSMAEVIRRESLQEGRRSLFLAGGLHVAKRSRAWPNEMGVPIGEATPVAWLELHHPGSTFVIQSMGAALKLELPSLVGGGHPEIVVLDEVSSLSRIEANRTTTLRNFKDGSRPDVYGTSTLADIVDAVILWDENQLTYPETDPNTYLVEWYWVALNRRSRMRRGRPMDESLRPVDDG